MKLSRIVAPFFILFVLSISFATQSSAQSLSGVFPSRINSDFTEFCAILLNGVPIVNADTPDGPLQLKAKSSGKLAVARIDRRSGKFIPKEKIAFRVAIKDYHSNTIWMFSEESFYELDYEELNKKLSPGDEVLIMTVDRKYRLPRHVLRSGDGC